MLIGPSLPICRKVEFELISLHLLYLSRNTRQSRISSATNSSALSIWVSRLVIAVNEGLMSRPYSLPKRESTRVAESREKWNNIKPDFLRFYDQEDRTLEETRSMIREIHGFNPRSALVFPHFKR